VKDHGVVIEAEAVDITEPQKALAAPSEQHLPEPAALAERWNRVVWLKV
jgi:hypothetical protein